MLVRAATGGSEEPGGVAIVKVDQGIVFVCESVDARQICYDPIHRKGTIGGDELVARSGGVGFLKLLFKIGEVVVGITEALGLAQADAVDDRGVVERVRYDGVVRGENSFKEPPVCIKARRVKDGVFGAEVFTEFFLKLAVQGLCSANETDRREPEAVARNRGTRGFANLGVIG